MAESQAQADVEKAPDTQSRDDASRPPRADWQLHPPDPTNDIIADKVIVLSFRNLQLKRIGALQDELIAFSLAREPLPPDHSDRVDQALRAYGGQSHIQPPQAFSDPLADIAISASIERLRDSLGERSPHHSHWCSPGRQHGNGWRGASDHVR